MAKKDNKYRGVYSRKTKAGLSYGIDYIHPLTGQRVRKILEGVKNQDEALKLKNIEIADAQRGAINKAYGLKAKTQAPLFSDMVEEYLGWSRENKRSWETDECRAKPLKRAFRGKLMTDINPFIVEKYKMSRVKKVAKTTVNKELIFGSQVVERSIEWNKYNGENPFLKAKRFKVKKGKKPGSLSPEEVRAIRDEIKHPVKRDMVDFAFNTGWRISEIRKLKWDDVNIETGCAWIVDPKNGDTAEIELNDEAFDIIIRQTKRSGHVFCHLNGNPFRTNLHAVIKNAAKHAGIYLPPRKAWHIFRRTWASMFLQKGGDVETLRVLGNWKDHSMPLWYADAADREHRRKLLNQIPKLDNIKNGTKMAPESEAITLTVQNNRQKK